MTVERLAGRIELVARVAGVVIACAIVPPRVRAQTDTMLASASHAYRARVMGVFDGDNGAPLAGVRVLDMKSGESATTTATGTVSLSFLPDGGGLVRLAKVGYQPITMAVAISPKDTAPLTIVMRQLVELPGVSTKAKAVSDVISPQLRGFEERRRLGMAGYFIGDSVLRAEENRRLADVLRTHAPSLILQEGRASASFLMKTARCAGSSAGPPQVYLDGVPLSPPLPIVNEPGRPRMMNPSQMQIDQLPFDLTLFSVSDLAGVEWYPNNDQLPEEFDHTGRRCGVLLLWTREK